MTNQIPPSRFQRVLRLFIFAEIVLFVLVVAVAMLEQRFLPPLLQQYLTSVAEADPTATLWLSIALGVPALILSIIAWIALWRGWRAGRRLYAIACLVSLPAVAFAGPVVKTGTGACIDAILSMVAGAILSLLFFSDLRELYVNRSA